MTKKELINALEDIDKQMEELRKCYEPYIGRRFDELSNDDQERIRKIWVLIQQLVNARADLRNKALYEFGIFVI